MFSESEGNLMSFTDEQLRAKAEAAAISLNTLTAKQREQTVTTVIVDDYNNLRMLVIEAHPDFERLLPPKVAMIEGSYGIASPNARCQDVQTFYAQIAGILKASNSMPRPTRLSR
jgi:hypothetical protein